MAQPGKVLPELAGRVMRIVQMNDLTVQDYIQICANEVRHLEEMYKKPIQYDPSILVMLACIAINERLGARFIKHKLRIMIEDTTQYYDPNVEAITLTYQHDGPLPCNESPSL